jgi:oxygen-independent coproporphyrinogen-3 oxidase
VTGETPEKQYIETLLNDLSQDLQLLNQPRTVSSIFIGGGTPSLFSAESFDTLLQGVSKLIPLQEGVEITLEANPGTFESQKFADYRAIGINRLSIGIQSFNSQHLKKLGRVHSAEESLAAVEIAHKAGFDNFNLDLMFGLPDQTNSEMLDDIQTAIKLQPSHISFYQLTLEPNTYFHKFPPKLPESDSIYAGQLRAQQTLADAGYMQYEISAYAKNNAKCQHNLNYWQFGDYLGIGAGAHGKLSISQPENIVRSVKHKSPEQYLRDNRASLTAISAIELPLEYVMNQLRLKAGFNLKQYEMHTGLGVGSLQPALSDCVKQGLLIQHREQYFCSDKGWDFLDHILEKFMP